MRKYIGEINFGKDKNTNIKNIISNNETSKVGLNFKLDYIIDSKDFSILDFPELGVRVLLDGELYNNDFNTPINDLAFLEKVIVDVKNEKMGFLQELNGSFNLILYDYEENVLRVINDRFATRPFYYFLNESSFIFSNRMSEIAKCMPSVKVLNKKAIIEFFQIQMVFGDKTFIEDIFTLEKATYNIITSGEIKENKYWEFRQDIDKKFNKKKIVSDLSGLMSDIINFKTADSAKYGILLSGGLDSRAILAADKENRITEVFTLGDSFNVECQISKSISDHKGANFNYIQRDIDHYNNIIQESVEIGDGMHNLLNGHFIGYLKQISEKVDVIFNGALIEQFWQGSKFIKRKMKIGKYMITLPMLLNKSNNDIEVIFSNFPRKVTGVDKIFNSKMNINFKKNTLESFKKMLIKNFGTENINHQETIDYLASDSYGRYSSHLNQLCINNEIKYRTIYDNRIIDLLLKVPIKYRSEGRLLKKAIIQLDSSLGEIPLAGSRIKMKRNSLLHWLSTNLVNVYYKFYHPDSYKSENSSWPNYGKLIIENNDIQTKISNIINNDDIILEDIFDRQYILKIFNEHIEGKKNHERVLFQILTFGEWYNNTFLIKHK